MRYAIVCCCLPLALAVMFAGCAQQGPDVNYVEGVVTLDGKPLEGVTVSFSPVDTTKGAPAVGTSDAQGVYTLTSTGGGAVEGGVMAGDYAVSFIKSSVEVISAEEAQRMQNDPNYGQAGAGRSAPPTIKELVPAAYGNSATSGMKVTVKEGQNTGDEFKFDLKSDFKGA